MQSDKARSLRIQKRLSEYFSEIGKVGGSKSRRTLTPEQARAMVAAREKKRIKKK